MVSEIGKIRRHLAHIEKLIQGLDQEDLRPLLMWQILACGPIHLDSIPPFLIDLAIEMDRHDRKFAFRTGHRPPNYADERILTVAARIMLWDYIGKHDDECFDEAILAIENKQKDVMPRIHAIRRARDQAPRTVRKYASDEKTLTVKFRKNLDKYVLPAAERIFGGEYPMRVEVPLY